MYGSLVRATQEATLRASGYGQKQHGNNKPFEEQQICDGIRRYGLGVALYQIEKKCREFYKRDDQMEWLDDIIVYAAAAKIVLKEQQTK